MTDDSNCDVLHVSLDKPQLKVFTKISPIGFQAKAGSDCELKGLSMDDLVAVHLTSVKKYNNKNPLLLVVVVDIMTLHQTSCLHQLLPPALTGSL